MFRCLVAVLLLFVGGPAWAAEDAVAPLEKVVGVRVTVDATGKIRSARPTNETLPAALNQATLELARQIGFKPATINGRPVESETTLQLAVRFEKRADGNFGLRLLKATAGTALRSIVPPMFPREEQRRGISGTIVAEFSLMPDGKVDMNSVRFMEANLTKGGERSEARFVAAVRESLKTMTVDQDTVGGRPMGYHGNMPFVFCATGTCDDLDPGAANRLTLKPTEANVEVPVMQWQQTGAGSPNA